MSNTYECQGCGQIVSKLMLHDCPLGKSVTATNNPKELEGMKKPSQAHMPQWPYRQQMLVHNLGAEKYGHFNWREEGVDVISYLSAARRHIDEFLDGLEKNSQNNWQGMGGIEDLFNDPESGAHVLAHACACFYILMDAQHCGKLIDNYTTPEVKVKTSGKPSNIVMKDAAVYEKAMKDFYEGNALDVKPSWDTVHAFADDLDEVKAAEQMAADVAEPSHFLIAGRRASANIEDRRPKDGTRAPIPEDTLNYRVPPPNTDALIARILRTYREQNPTLGGHYVNQLRDNLYSALSEPAHGGAHDRRDSQGLA